MHSSPASVAPRFLLSIDWSKNWKNRAVYLLDTEERCIRPAGASPRETPDRRPWTVSSTLAFARSLAARGTVLLSYDAPLGVPASYFQAAIQLAPWREARSFVDWMPWACSDTNFLQNGRSAESWRIDRPFFAVPEGKGALKAFENAAAQASVRLRRRIEELSHAKPVFLTSGIPGTVGSGAIDLWTGLARELTPERDFGIWPFEGRLEELLATRRIVVGEIYPRAAYAVALSSLPPSERAPLKVAKDWCRAAGSLIPASHSQQGISRRQPTAGMPSMHS
jgi:hypothetical protein